MPIGTVDIVAPKSLVIPNGLLRGAGKISGSIWVSGATLEFMGQSGIVTLS